MQHLYGNYQWRNPHDDVIKWKHVPRHWLFVRGIHRSPVNSPHKGQWRGALMFSLICTRINGWVNNGEAGDFRRHRVHHDVIVMHQVYERAVMKDNDILDNVIMASEMHELVADMPPQETVSNQLDGSYTSCDIWYVLSWTIWYRWFKARLQ